MACLLQIIISTFIFSFLFAIVLSDNLFKKPLFNTKTPYFWVRNISDVIQENEFSTAILNGETCQLEGLNILLRHGSRFPTLKWIKRMTALHSKLTANAAILSKYPFMNKWTNPFPENQQGLLSTLGVEEMKILGKRFGTRFKVLLDGKLNQVKFATSFRDRTKSSFKNFYNGLNEASPSSGPTPEAKVDNTKTRFYERCSKYMKEVDDNDEILKEANLFEAGSKISNIVQKVQTKLGTSNISIDFDDIFVIHQICAFELGLNGQSDWCQFFNIDDLRVISYWDDLEEYYKTGYGYPINWQQTCPYTSYVFERFEDAVTNSEKPNSIPPIDIFFGHQDTILPIFTAFGLFKDSGSFTATNYDANINRKFSSSEITPFSANIAFSLYRCGANQKHAFKIFVNEDPVNIPACGGTVCAYSDVKSYYKELAQCDFDKICDTSSAVRFRGYTILSIVLVLITVMI
ncbi:multiple inositol polyphosphate phosphatase 1-like [Mytilus galloprovincialis]|uniref:multiple inositol polyphosphate phosphatase 1-like n=1 Tax=Mytilus galloprovincialis TaxID=29158 RepID=UPI003F7B8D61